LALLTVRFVAFAALATLRALPRLAELRSSTAWRDQPVIYSILSQLLPMLALRSNPLAILGPIQQQPMAS